MIRVSSEFPRNLETAQAVLRSLAHLFRSVSFYLLPLSQSTAVASMRQLFPRQHLSGSQIEDVLFVKSVTALRNDGKDASFILYISTNLCLLFHPKTLSNTGVLFTFASCVEGGSWLRSSGFAPISHYSFILSINSVSTTIDAEDFVIFDHFPFPQY